MTDLKPERRVAIPEGLEERQMIPGFWPHKGASPSDRLKAQQAAQQKNASQPIKTPEPTRQQKGQP